MFDQKVDAGVGLAFGSPVFFPFSASGMKIRTYAGFADMTYEVASGLFLTGGLRYSHDQVARPYYQATPGIPGVFTVRPDYNDDKLSPRVVLRYKPSDESSIYASFTKGFKSAVFDVRATSGSDFLKPEDINAYEVGYKFGNSRLSAELAGFYYDYKNLQNGYYKIGATFLSNAARTRIKGVEASLRYDFGGGFDVSAAGTYLDAKYRDYKVAGFFKSTFIPDNDGDGRPEFAGFDTSQLNDSSGLQMQRAPKFTGTVAARYTTQLAGGELVASANLYHTSSFYFDPAHQFRQGAYEIVSARIQWTDPSDRYTIAIFGDNLTDTKYYSQVNAGTVAVSTVYGKPATYGASLRVKM
jgi:iron complex outermembrane receptor protein